MTGWPRFRLRTHSHTVLAKALLYASHKLAPLCGDWHLQHTAKEGLGFSLSSYLHHIAQYATVCVCDWYNVCVCLCFLPVEIGGGFSFHFHSLFPHQQFANLVS